MVARCANNLVNKVAVNKVAVNKVVSRVAKVRRKVAVKAAVNKAVALVAVSKAVAVAADFSPCRPIASSAFRIGPSAWSTASAIRIRE